VYSTSLPIPNQSFIWRWEDFKGETAPVGHSPQESVEEEVGCVRDALEHSNTNKSPVQYLGRPPRTDLLPVEYCARHAEPVRDQTKCHASQL
jgi:hypothetical protein